MRLDFSGILERMLRAGGLRSGSELARAVGVTPQAITNYKKKGEMPARLVFDFAEIYGVSVDWLITGAGQMFRSLGAGSGKVSSEGAGALNETAAHIAGKPIDVTTLKPDEILYIGKLLKVMRGPAEFAAPGVKVSIDAFLKAAYPASTSFERSIGSPAP